MATEIMREHREYAAKKRMWRMYRHLYAGGEELRANAAEYLIPRQREPRDVYQERLNRVFYENYAGSIIDWYAATLFRREPILSFEGENQRSKDFFAEFTEDCDLKGTALSDFFRKRFTETLIYGSSFVLIDFPRHKGWAGSRAEEDALGFSRAYLVGYTPEDIVNWERNSRGSLEWVVVRLKEPGLGEEDRHGYWVRYDREEFVLYRSDGKREEVLDRGAHAMAQFGRTPLVEMTVPEGLWLMNKAALLQLEHFNKSNALSWALTMGLFAMPVVYTDREWEQMVGESYYIQLGQGDRFGWTEPEGKVYQIAAENLERLKDEIYRVCYLLTQAGGPMAGGAAQSGLSKQRDYAITQEILRAYGDGVKDAIRRVLRAVNEARGDGLTIGVAGMDEFDIGEFSSELSDAERLLKLGIESPTLKKQILKRLASKYLCDVRQDIKDRIAGEIEQWVDGERKP
jgi:hypothetical protein